MFHQSPLIQKIAIALHKELIGTELAECFSQNKDELILIFRREQTTFCIKADLRPQVSLLSFPDSFSRARKNSVDLFHSLKGLEVVQVTQHPLNRSFEIDFGASSLIFKLYGRRSNILHFQDDTLQTLFRSELKQDVELKRAHFLANSSYLDEVLSVEVAPHLPKPVYQHLTEHYSETKLRDALAELLSPPTYVTDGDKPGISLLKNDLPHTESFMDVLEAVNHYHQLYVRKVLFEEERRRLTQHLQKKITQTENYISKTESKLGDLENRRSYREIADILMANLHQIHSEQSEVSLFDFYKNEQITIKLKEKLSPQLQAEQLYKKSKNEQLEVRKLNQNIQQKKVQLEQLVEELESLEQVVSWKELRRFGTSDVETNDQKQLPYFSFHYKNFEIRVGKDAKRNDQLTTRFASKDDYWLHAKDVPGSHVVIRNPSKNKPPSDVIEHAARLAAYYSKRKQDTLCPVLYTPRKYVRKAKKLTAGQVIVEREEVVMVEPLNPHKT